MGFSELCSNAHVQRGWEEARSGGGEDVRETCFYSVGGRGNWERDNSSDGVFRLSHCLRWPLLLSLIWAQGQGRMRSLVWSIHAGLAKLLGVNASQLWTLCSVCLIWEPQTDAVLVITQGWGGE